MSVVSIQFGQCGNQVGYDWLTTIGQDLKLGNVSEPLLEKTTYMKQSFDRWFYCTSDEPQFFARTVLVDTEEKVVNNVCKKASTTQVWKYNPESIIYRKDGGCGNNWALGYFHRGCEMEDEILNCVRKEVENCDWLSSFHYVLGCAGGTGSGLGSRIVSDLQDDFSSKSMISSLILPYVEGEVVTQNFNVILTLHKMYDSTDLQVFFQNQDLHRICVNSGGRTRVEFQDINSIISINLLSFLQPVSSDSQNHLPTIISNLSPHPCYKIASINSAPYYSIDGSKHNSNISWNSLVKHAIHSLQTCNTRSTSNAREKNMKPSHQNLFKYERCVANVLITRGSDGVSSNDYREIYRGELYPEWIPADARFHHFHQKQPLLNFQKYLSLVSNNSSINESLNSFVKKAWSQFSQKAYLHQYTKYGLEEEDFSAAFLKIEDIIKHYQDITK